MIEEWANRSDQIKLKTSLLFPQNKIYDAFQRSKKYVIIESYLHRTNSDQ